MTISYDHYRIFYYVAKYKSFTRAAEILYSNQPNLTRTIKSLEQALGCTLFQRSNKGVQLTDDGRKLYEHIAIAFEHIQAGEEAISLGRSLQNGMVSIGASEIALRCYLLPILREFHRLYPSVRIKILNVSTPQAVKMLEEKLVDLAVVTTPLTTPPHVTESRLQDFREVPVCGNAFYTRFENTPALTFKQLAAHPVISLGHGTSTFEFYVTLFSKYGCPFSPDIEAATADQILPLVEHDLGIGFVPEAFLDGVRDDTVRVIPLADPLPTRSITLVKRNDHALPPPAKELERMMTK